MKGISWCQGGNKVFKHDSLGRENVCCFSLPFCSPEHYHNESKNQNTMNAGNLPKIKAENIKILEEYVEREMELIFQVDDLSLE